MNELLEDPLVLLLMMRDGVTRSEVEALMAALRSQAIDRNERSEFPCLQLGAIPDSALLASQ